MSDLAVKIPCGSSAYGQWELNNLNAEYEHRAYAKVSFAHGFMTLKSSTEMSCNGSDCYNAVSEGVTRQNNDCIAWLLDGYTIPVSKNAIAQAFRNSDNSSIYGKNS